MRLEFETSSDETAHNRAIYTLFDLLGDIGGLLEMMTYLAQIVWSIVNRLSGSQLTKYLIGVLFFTDRVFVTNQEERKLGQTTLKHDLVKSVKSQQRISFSCCLRMRSKRSRDLRRIKQFEKGENRIANELDIVHFIRQQKITQVALKHLFNKVEYFLMKRQPSFVLDSNSSTHSGDEDFQSEQFWDDVTETPSITRLSKGILRRKRTDNSNLFEMNQNHEQD